MFVVGYLHSQAETGYALERSGSALLFGVGFPVPFAVAAASGTACKFSTLALRATGLLGGGFRGKGVRPVLQRRAFPRNVPCEA